MKAWCFGFFLAASLSLRAGTLTDFPVRTDDGRVVHFLSEVVAGKTAFINFVYTDCGGMCPLQGRNFAVLSRALHERLAKDVVLISVSIAPEVGIAQAQAIQQPSRPRRIPPAPE